MALLELTRKCNLCPVKTLAWASAVVPGLASRSCCRLLIRCGLSGPLVSCTRQSCFPPLWSTFSPQSPLSLPKFFSLLSLSRRSLSVSRALSRRAQDDGGGTAATTAGTPQWRMQAWARAPGSPAPSGRGCESRALPGVAWWRGSPQARHPNGAAAPARWRHLSAAIHLCLGSSFGDP